MVYSLDNLIHIFSEPFGLPISYSETPEIINGQIWQKNSQKLRNPFVYQGYVSPEYFCDRTEETEELIANLQNGRNTILISPRRIGKTGLIKNAFYRILEREKDAKCLYIDIFATRNQHDFVQLLGTAIAHCEGVTRNIQLMLNRLYETERHVTKTEQVDEAIRHIVNRNSMQYEELIGFLTDNQLAISFMTISLPFG